VSPGERVRYLSGDWKVDPLLPASVILRWHRRWRKDSPQHLYPGSSPNEVYVGVELPPVVPALEDGLWYTEAQHAAVAELAEDLRIRHNWPGFKNPSPRLVGHEDLDAYGRWDTGGGWDPGYLRPTPRFRWDMVYAHLAAVGAVI